MNEKGNAVAIMDRTVYIGENVKITVKSNGEVTSRAL